MEVFLRKLSKAHGVKICLDRDCTEALADALATCGAFVEPKFDSVAEQQSVLEAFAIINGEIRAPCFVLSEDGPATSVRALFLGTKGKGDVKGDDTASAAILDSRRVTERNVLKWSQQILNTLHSIHKNYVTIGSFGLDNVSLRSSDGHVVEAFFAFDERIGLDRSRRGDEDASSVATGGGSSASSTVDTTWEEFGRQAWIDLVQRPHTCARAFSDLKALGGQFQCTIRLDSVAAEKLDAVRAAFNELVDRMHEDLRAMGVVILQLVLLQVFSAPEVKFWTNFQCNLANAIEAEDAAPNDRSPPKKATIPKAETLQKRLAWYLYASSDPAAPLRDTGRKINRLLDEVEATLCSRLPELATSSPMLRRILSFCFLPRLPVLDDLDKVRLQLVFPLWDVYCAINKGAKEEVLEHYEAARYVKPSLWTEEDELQRLQTHAVRAQRLHAKAEAGLAEAKQRIRNAKYQVWWDLQSDGYKQRMERQRKARLVAERRRMEARGHIHMALMQKWSGAELHKWLHLAIASYFHVICFFGAHALSIRPKQPEVYVSRLLHDLHELCDEFTVGRVYDRYYDPQSRGADKVLAAHANILNFHDFSGDLGSLASVSTKSTSSRSERASVLSSAMSRSSRALSSSGSASLPSRKQRRIAPKPVVHAPGSLIASNAQTDLTVHMDNTITVEEIMSSGPKRGLVVDLGQRTVATLKIMAFHVATLVVQRCDGLLLGKMLRQALAAGEKVDGMVSTQKLVYLSPQQLHFKKLGQQSAHLMQLQPSLLRQSVYAFFDEIKVLDRARAKLLLHMVCAALLHQYVCDSSIRLKGEDVAAHIIVAFFRMLRVRRKLLPLLRADVGQITVHNYEIRKKKARPPEDMRAFMQMLGQKAAANVSVPKVSKVRLAPIAAERPPAVQPSLSSTPTVEALVVGVRGTLATVQLALNLPLPSKAAPRSSDPASTPSVKDLLRLDMEVLDEDAAVETLHARAYVFGPRDCESADPPGRRPLLCIYVQTPVRASVFDPFMLMGHKFSSRFSPACSSVPCSLHRADASEDRKGQPAAAAGKRVWLANVDLAAVTAYDVVIELDADVVQHLTARVSAQRGGVQSLDIVAGSLSSCAPFKPTIFSAQGAAFRVPQPVQTEGRAPKGLERVWAAVQYSSDLPPLLKGGLIETVPALPFSHLQPSPQKSMLPAYDLRFAVPGLGIVRDFSCLLQLTWRRSGDDYEARTTYSVQRRFVLLVDPAQCDQMKFQTPPQLVGLANGRQYLCAFKSRWSDCKERARAGPLRGRPAPAEGEFDEELVGTNDYLSTVSEDFKLSVNDRCLSLVRFFYVPILAKESHHEAGTDDIVDSGIRLLVQYRVKVHNSCGDGAFSLTALQFEGPAGAAGLGFAEVAEVVLPRDSLTAHGKYRALPSNPALESSWEASLDDWYGDEESVGPRGALGMTGVEVPPASAEAARSHSAPAFEPSPSSVEVELRPISSGRPKSTHRSRPGSRRSMGTMDMDGWLQALSFASPMLERPGTSSTAK